MDEMDNTDSLEITSMRMERALARLEKSATAVTEQREIISKLQNDVAHLSMQNNEYAIKFDRSARREKKLDAGAEQVSHSLVDAMETIRSVLVKQGFIMAEVNIEINGRKYRMACEDGQESQLVQSGERFDSLVEGFQGEIGEIGDNRLTIMAGIAVVDALVEADETIAKLRAELGLLTSQGEKLGGAHLELE